MIGTGFPHFAVWFVDVNLVKSVDSSMSSCCLPLRPVDETVVGAGVVSEIHYADSTWTRWTSIDVHVFVLSDYADFDGDAAAFRS